ncbi:Nif3-like dinuclear metal center hexameric protein [Enterobacteriaceae endosymbiont of Donacia tomentosa]|uniref:Nif3-like dinuclear metal center hexameric protein n=1 Tax=Enterobacteriaceae endosymbiont of Donacia tomentosa TaxID=2675787 RepID=UPI0014496D0B|nr:Nif3-like dinuclear metal center hexameric protein [Enterobacteriaceae endosymbiont of Donacia tomentosa]QJC31886.1 Nif3-like dinuclear metal center hexameric protein [Enterobacteriaceae endosymbiont of Donacia tomentosa]
MNNYKLEAVINKKLNIKTNLKDYAPNGLQIEGKNQIKNIITGVSASQKLLNKAILLKTDAVIVHHGYFWKNESPIITGIKKKRICQILLNNINLYSWHFPLDISYQLGNNIYLAKLLNINVAGKINSFVFYGYLKNRVNIKYFIFDITKKLNRTPLHFGENAPKEIYKIAWCTGAGQKFLEEVANFGADVFITGEVSENNLYIAREHGIHFISAGHYATEKGGVIMLGQWLKNKFNLKVNFININNPV